MFKRLEIGGWRQFGLIDISFHPNLTVLTGANGSGKTTMLNILSRHMGWDLRVVSTPIRPKRGPISFISDLWRRITAQEESTASQHRIGQITYADEATTELLVPENVSQQYQIQLSNQKQVPGIFISSHRPIYLYEPVAEMPTSPSTPQELLDLYVNDLRVRYRPGHGFRSPTYHLKRALLSLATLGYGNPVVRESHEAIETFEGFQEVLRNILPPSLGFRKFELRLPEIALITDTGEFSLDAVSGGISALIDIAWQVYLRCHIDPESVVLIDEPENHLHPELQRIILPNLIGAFPDAQFIVATHNPFVVSSVPDSNVYVLTFGDDGRVGSFLLDMVNKAGSSNDILRDVLGLSTTLPLWVDAKIQEILNKYLPTGLDESTFSRLKSELAEVGLAEFMPETLTRLLDAKSDSAN